jgi:hypothetical protein
MTLKRRLLILFAVLCLGSLAALPALASHEANNALTFAPVASSPSPDASGEGIVNYVSGQSTSEPDTAWTSSFHFSGLAGNTTYTIVLFMAGVPHSGICSFTSNVIGNGGCSSTFGTLDRFGSAQLRLGGEAGTPVLQATRHATGDVGPGEIIARGDCREPDQLRSLCDAPGR